MFNSILILYKVISFIFLKNDIIEENYRFYTLLFNHYNIISATNQNQNTLYQKNKKNYIYCHKYNYSNRASYHDSVYIVKPGDTLFYIAWITGNNCLSLAKNNNIKNIDVLQINQILKVNNRTMKSFFLKRMLKKISLSFCNIHYKVTQLFVFKNIKPINLKIKECILDSNIIKKDNIIVDCQKNTSIPISNVWNWPTQGAIINTFSDTEGGNTGIDISGTYDQPILAATNGQVVYIGNILKGYGNLVIIKHRNNYLSAYAHNNKILVVERQYVKKGDQIATMGKSGTNEIKLHFEIRYKGKSINPLCLLP